MSQQPPRPLVPLATGENEFIEEIILALARVPDLHKSSSKVIYSATGILIEDLKRIVMVDCGVGYPAFDFNGKREYWASLRIASYQSLNQGHKATPVYTRSTRANAEPPIGTYTSRIWQAAQAAMHLFDEHEGTVMRAAVPAVRVQPEPPLYAPPAHSGAPARPDTNESAYAILAAWKQEASDAIHQYEQELIDSYRVTLGEAEWARIGALPRKEQYRVALDWAELGAEGWKAVLAGDRERHEANPALHPLIARTHPVAIVTNLAFQRAWYQAKERFEYDQEHGRDASNDPGNDSFLQ